MGKKKTNRKFGITVASMDSPVWIVLATPGALALANAAIHRSTPRSLTERYIRKACHSQVCSEVTKCCVSTDTINTILPAAWHPDGRWRLVPSPQPPGSSAADRPESMQEGHHNNRRYNKRDRRKGDGPSVHATQLSKRRKGKIGTPRG